MDDRRFEMNQLKLSKEVDEQLVKVAAAYEVLVSHVGDPDILEQMEAFGLPTSLPTVFRVATLVANGVLVKNSAYLLAMLPMAPFPHKDEVRERIWKELGWDSE